MSLKSKPTNPADTYESYFVPAKFGPCAQILLGQAKPQPGEHVLDVACGTGVVARMVAPWVGPTGRVVGLDINAAMLATARSQSTEIQPPIEFREGSALAMTLPDASFDLVVCQQGLQFFPDQSCGCARDATRAKARRSRCRGVLVRSGERPSRQHVAACSGATPQHTHRTVG
jgi:SAM-dependent methyltransferase